MSINQVEAEKSNLASNIPFVFLDQSERVIFSSPTARQSLCLSLMDCKIGQVNITAKNGTLFLTNKRLIYMTGSQGDINNFQIILKDASSLRFSHELKSPLLGANYWEFVFFSSAGGPSNMSPKDQWFKGQIKFNDSGIFNFIQKFDEVLHDSINNQNVDEELPRYTPTIQ
ncbi:uncharacterized protein PRCAT00001200001 [Priceomyces carsonii]|uniref:uncharacterized protein n=1 Tax=Priceomyces carsonii TaxID=28549 RepID=UPI002ED7F9CC|nr:unnamed protein product [Priceomyces carsonii]